MSERTYPTLIFDLDGTLVRCREFYDAAVTEFGSVTADRLGLPPQEAEELVRQIDMCAIRAGGNWMRERWPRSFRAASLAADALVGQEPDLNAALQAEDIAEQTFSAPYPLYAGVREVLEQYLQGGWRMLLYTKGDPDVQLRKVRINDLDTLFARSQVEVTPKKSVTRLIQLCARHQVNMSESWVIGDSRRDDIGPALSAGLRTIQVMTSTWDYDRAEHIAHAEVATVADLPQVIPTFAPSEGTVLFGVR